MKLFTLTQDTLFSDKPNIHMMGETPFSKEIRICLGKDAFMKEHQAPAAISIELFSGEIELSTPEETRLMHAGDIVVFEAKVPHSLLAKKNSIVRLSLSKIDSFQRVQNLILTP